MADETIVTKVVLEGDAEVDARLKALGASGNKSLGQIGDGADAASVSLTKAGTAGGAAAAVLREGFRGAAAPVQEAEGAFSKFAASLGAFGGRVRTSVPQVKALNDASDQAGRSANVSNVQFVKFGQTLRLLGRAARLPELSVLGRSLGVVGRAAALAIPAILVAGLGKLALGAAENGQKFQDFAGKLGISTDAARKLQNVSTALGLSTDKTQGSFESLNKLVKEAATNEKAAAAETKNFQKQMSDAEGAIGDTDKAQKALNKTQTDLNLSLAKGEISSKDYVDKQKELRDQQKEINKQNAEAVNKFNDLAIAQQKAKGEAIANQNVLQQLGVNLTDTNGKLVKGDEAFARLAGALANVTDKEQRTRIEQELIAQGIDRNLLPALRRGEQGFIDLQKQGDKIRPPFNDAQLATLDKLSIAAGQVAQAFGSIADAIGVAVAPTFTAFFEQLVQILQQIRPGLAQFGEILANIIGPVLSGIGSVISNIVVPAFQILQGIVQGLVNAFNQAFGTNVTVVQALSVAVAALVLVFGGWIPIILAIVAAVGLVIQKLLEIPGVRAFIIAMLQAFQALLTFIVGDLLTGIIAMVKGFIDGINTIVNGWKALEAIVAAVWAAIVKAASDAINAVVEFFQPFIDKVKSAWEWVKRLAQALSSIGAASRASQTGAGAAGAVGAAGGGYIRGRGTKTSDSILARLSRGEFVIRAAAVDKYGVRLMHAINQMRIPRDHVPAFSLGGFVDAFALRPPMPAFASGGLVSTDPSGTPINLTIDSETFNLISKDEETAKRLTRFAIGKRIRAGGNKPGFYR